MLIMSLDNFTVPVCKKCGTDVQFVERTSADCNHPECIASADRWTIVRCPKCETEELPT